MPSAVKLYEIYTSISGETHHAGRPTTLVRFAGCDLRCSYCDTAHAFSGGADVALEAIVAECQARGAKLILLTGGEPLLQRELPALAERLLDLGFQVMVETGGHRDIAPLPRGLEVILDMKTPDSGESHKMHLPNLDRVDENDAVKFVIGSRGDYEWSRAIIAKHSLIGRCHVLLSPSFGVLEPRLLVEWMLEDRLEARLNLQLHKYVWPPETRGV